MKARWLLGLPGLLAFGAPEQESNVVWREGEDGYHTCRIPAAIMTKRGTLLAFCGGRACGLFSEIVE